MSAASPDYIEPLEGWRLWRVSRDGGGLRLRSLVQDTLWPPREELAAGCLRRRALARLHRPRAHEAPAESCACGIYATSLERLGSYLQQCGDGRTHYVFGRVHLWGSVIQCEQGWRAGRAYPAEIIVPTPIRATRTDGGGIKAFPSPRDGASAAEEMADLLRCYAVPVRALPHSPTEALEVVARDQGRADRTGLLR